jgi:hypothetical protein
MTTKEKELINALISGLKIDGSIVKRQSKQP